MSWIFRRGPVDHAQLITAIATVWLGRRQSDHRPAVCAGQAQCSAAKLSMSVVRLSMSVCLQECDFPRFFSDSSLANCVEVRDRRVLHTLFHLHDIESRPLSAVTACELPHLAWTSRIKVRRALRSGHFAHSSTCVHLASRAQPVSGFPAELQLWMFELWLGVLRETLGGQCACLRKVACVCVGNS